MEFIWEIDHFQCTKSARHLVISTCAKIDDLTNQIYINFIDIHLLVLYYSISLYNLFEIY